MKVGRYHHGDLPSSLIEAALSLVEERGAESFSMREVARRAGVSSGAPYRHFPDVDALLRAASREVAQAIHEAQQAAATEHAEPALRFRAMGVATVRYAFEHPQLFRMHNHPRWRDPEDPETQRQQELHSSAIRAALRTSMESGGLDPALDPALVLLTVQATVYGLARMLLDGHLPSETLTPEEVERLASSVLERLGTGLKVRGEESR